MYLKILICFYFLFHFSVAMNMYAQTSSYKPMEQAEEFKVNLREYNRETRTVKSDFKQYKHLDILSRDIISTGKFYFEKKNRLRWEYTEPFEYLIIFNENDILIRDESRESRYDTNSNTLFKQISQLMTSVIQGEVLEDAGNFSAEYLQNELEYLIVLNPRSKQYGDFFQRIEIYFDRNELSVKKVIFFEQSEDKTIIEFTNSQRNEAIPDSVFDIH